MISSIFDASRRDPAAAGNRSQTDFILDARPLINAVINDLRGKGGYEDATLYESASGTHVKLVFAKIENIYSMQVVISSLSSS